MVQLELFDEHLIGSSGGLQLTKKTHRVRHFDRNKFFLEHKFAILRKLVGSNFIGFYFEYRSGLYMQRWYTYL